MRHSQAPALGTIFDPERVYSPYTMLGRIFCGSCGPVNIHIYMFYIYIYVFIYATMMISIWYIVHKQFQGSIILSQGHSTPDPRSSLKYKAARCLGPITHHLRDTVELLWRAVAWGG